MIEILLLFLAGFFSEAIVTVQTLAISRRHAPAAAAMSLLGWSVWGLALSSLILDRMHIIPFALGAAIGTYLVSVRKTNGKT